VYWRPALAAGVGCTCALASVPAKKGEHRCEVAAYGVAGVTEYSLTMEKGRRERWEEDGVASRLVVQALADAAARSTAAAAASGKSEAAPPEPGDAAGKAHAEAAAAPGSDTDARAAAVDVVGPWLFPPGDALRITRAPLGDPLEWLAAGEGDLVELARGAPSALGATACTLVLPGGAHPARRPLSTSTASRRSSGPCGLVPAPTTGRYPHSVPRRRRPWSRRRTACKALRGGSFNPLHDGHRGMLAAAAALRPGAAPCFELAVTNADKGTLPLDEVRRRAAQFASDDPVGGEGPAP